MTTCADASRAASEPLGGTGIVAERWLCVESRAPWGRDAITDGGHDPDVAAWLAAHDAKVLAIRRPGSRSGPVRVFAARPAETGRGELRTLALDDLASLPGTDPWVDGAPVDGTLLLVCAHGRRDACCSRLGVPVFSALDAARARATGGEGPLTWQCSHTGGHRFAPNVVALPWGVTLGRVDRADAQRLIALLGEGRVPLDTYRGRSLYPAAGQAAEVAVRRALGLDRLDALRLVGADDAGTWTFTSPDGGSVAARVTEVEGPTLPKSCGAEPGPVAVHRARLLTE